MLVTISSAGTATTSSTHSRSRPCIWSPNANTEASTTPAAPGLGRPVKYRLSAVGSMVVLKRASRIAAQATQRKQTTQPSGSHSSRPSENSVKASSAGARPKDTRSASESNCSPNGVTAPTRRATAPSTMSKSTDSPISTAASPYSPRIDTRIATKPHTMLASVNRLGRVASARRRVPRTEPRTNSTVAVRRVGGTRGPSAGRGPAGDDGLAAPHALPLRHGELARPAARRRPSASRTSSGPSARRWPGCWPTAGAGHDPPGQDADDLPEDDGAVAVAEPQLAALVAVRGLLAGRRPGSCPCGRCSRRPRRGRATG